MIKSSREWCNSGFCISLIEEAVWPINRLCERYRFVSPIRLRSGQAVCGADSAGTCGQQDQADLSFGRGRRRSSGSDFLSRHTSALNSSMVSPMSLMMPRSVPFQILGAVHGDDHSPAIAGAVIDGMAAALSIEVESKRLSDSDNFPGADGGGFGIVMPESLCRAV
jgi:hypothetical protein